jgi:hypothetical protein
MSQTISECCVTGHLHDGQAEGAISVIEGIKTYIAEPEGGSKAKTIFFIADIFGYDLPVLSGITDLIVECANPGR